MRIFTVQALKNCELLKLNFEGLKRRNTEFNSAFEALFKNGDLRLERVNA